MQLAADASLSLVLGIGSQQKVVCGREGLKCKLLAQINQNHAAKYQVKYQPGEISLTINSGVFFLTFFSSISS